MRLKNYPLSVLIIINALLYNPAVIKAQSPITAGHLISTADCLALTIAHDAELFFVSSSDVDTTGKANSWDYVYCSIDSLKEYHFHTEDDSVHYDGWRNLRDGIGIIEEIWIDSDSAVCLAELNEGIEFRTVYPESIIEASLYSPCCPPFYTYWVIKYIGTDFSIVIMMNAFNGQICTSVNHSINNDRPTADVLLLNYPNPFNTVTTIQYQLLKASLVKIEIYNLLGQHVITLVDKTKPPGLHTVQWDGRNKYECDSASGIYFCKLEIDRRVKMSKLALLR